MGVVTASPLSGARLVGNLVLPAKVDRTQRQIPTSLSRVSFQFNPFFQNARSALLSSRPALFKPRNRGGA